jgi:uncharacterized lipoprotein YajG
MMPPNNIIIQNVKTQLTAKGFDFAEAEKADEFLTVLITEIMTAVKQATVTTVVTGTLTPPAAVTGTGTGFIK